MEIIDNTNTKIIPLHFLDVGDIFKFKNEIYLFYHESLVVPNGIECFNFTTKSPSVRASDTLVTQLSDVMLTINR